MCQHICCALRLRLFFLRCIFFFNVTATPEIYTLSLHDALPICHLRRARSLLSRLPACSNTRRIASIVGSSCSRGVRSEEHTSELQSRRDLVCRLLLEKKKKCRNKDTFRGRR